MNSEGLIEATPCPEVSDGNPSILRVPDDWWQCAKNKHRKEKVKAGSFEFAAQPWGERQHKDDGNELESVGVFAKETRPNKQSSQWPKPIEIWTSLHRQPEREHRRRPEEDRE